MIYTRFGMITVAQKLDDAVVIKVKQDVQFLLENSGVVLDLDGQITRWEAMSTVVVVVVVGA